jgi:hypothetical protein
MVATGGGRHHRRSPLAVELAMVATIASGDHQDRYHRDGHGRHHLYRGGHHRGKQETIPTSRKQYRHYAFAAVSRWPIALFRLSAQLGTCYSSSWVFRYSLLSCLLCLLLDPPARPSRGFVSGSAIESTRGPCTGAAHAAPRLARRPGAAHAAPRLARRPCLAAKHMQPHSRHGPPLCRGRAARGEGALLLSSARGEGAHGSRSSPLQAILLRAPLVSSVPGFRPPTPDPPKPDPPTLALFGPGIRPPRLWRTPSSLRPSAVTARLGLRR